ncbi:putative TrmH family tRNA/rRNA methyltransferase YacO [Virgibacillus pantothenticus]|uniref:RNA methyltransferase n=1 Tax=Virgibacillus pantothenticus TaxID=1473 RepID=A0A0L0QVI4_VIRPA|nr:23S rRNA (guanosine(2251)-2'-O)-methyltransferase RlmB [Virgibacillus pantothenticus]KNE22700.1 RNA methyltransferase [Virgibacillus pantothenticus]MBU8566937.1 23S rRNA (guanosine(2251)-2'-O)-methyltransferase RlmB [Virgibacillus pantothenticus]MBU8602513.1 23S rRNA (guanosine(2251)-2'-O)-methyltransferase RlmB [Virgibacillus pantothenticus]MBU8634965.1 23S rRNA (guanosine(2251)-2'-O)-methyltransferase RlmB [Virgibacillus pantothenticus]MBU8642793.1 23S rRNA (guanosine(2251)-2'-O)-methyltr
MEQELIMGKNPVIEAIRSGRSINKVLVSEQLNPSVQAKFFQLGKSAGTIVQKVPKHKIDQLSKGGNHQGVVAYVASYEYATLDDLFQRAEEQNEAAFFLILDELEDPHNLGSILRTADAVGAHGVIIPKRRSVGLTATVAKTAAGAIEHVPVVRVTNIANTIDELKKRQVWVVGTEANATEDYRQLEGTLPLAIVIGNEGKGISHLVKKKCDWTVSLPMKGKVSSLNASVACSLLLYEVYRKRNPFGE